MLLGWCVEAVIILSPASWNVFLLHLTLLSDLKSVILDVIMLMYWSYTRVLVSLIISCYFNHLVWDTDQLFVIYSALKAVEILEAYEGTLEDDHPPDNERCEHGEMLLYKVLSLMVWI